MDIKRPTATRELKIGDRVPMPAKKLDVRPAFDGNSRTSYKPARKPGLFC